MSTQMHEFLQNRSRDQGLLQLQDSAIAEVHPAVEERKRAPFGCPPGVPGPPKSEGRGDSGRWRGNWFKHASSMGLGLGLAFSKRVTVTWRHDGF